MPLPIINIWVYITYRVTNIYVWSLELTNVPTKRQEIIIKIQRLFPCYFSDLLIFQQYIKEEGGNISNQLVIGRVFTPYITKMINLIIAPIWGFLRTAEYRCKGNIGLTCDRDRC